MFFPFRSGTLERADPATCFTFFDERGLIAARFAHSGWSLRNLPNVLALQPFDYAE